MYVSKLRHSLTFILNTEDAARQLQVVKPYAFWGVPTFKASSLKRT